MELLKETSTIVAYSSLDALRHWMDGIKKGSESFSISNNRLRTSDIILKRPSKFGGDIRYRTSYCYADITHDRGVHDVAGLQAHRVLLVDGFLSPFQNNYLQSRLREICDCGQFKA